MVRRYRAIKAYEEQNKREVVILDSGVSGLNDLGAAAGGMSGVSSYSDARLALGDGEISTAAGVGVPEDTSQTEEVFLMVV